MRVRPFFWVLLAASCIGVLVFAASKPVHVPAVVQVHLDQQHAVAAGYTTVTLHLTDTQGLPIEEARVFSRARHGGESEQRELFGTGKLRGAAATLYGGSLANQPPGTGRRFRYGASDALCAGTMNT